MYNLPAVAITYFIVGTLTSILFTMDDKTKDSGQKMLNGINVIFFWPIILFSKATHFLRENKENRSDERHAHP